jgi:hypothetical protein
MIGFIAHLYNSLLHFTNHYTTYYISLSVTDFTGHCLVTDVKNDYSSSSVLESHTEVLTNDNSNNWVPQGCAIAEAVNRWLPTEAAQVDPKSGHMGFVVDKVVMGQVFS